MFWVTRRTFELKLQELNITNDRVLQPALLKQELSPIVVTFCIDLPIFEGNNGILTLVATYLRIKEVKLIQSTEPRRQDVQDGTRILNVFGSTTNSAAGLHITSLHSTFRCNRKSNVETPFPLPSITRSMQCFVFHCKYTNLTFSSVFFGKNLRILMFLLTLNINSSHYRHNIISPNEQRLGSQQVDASLPQAFRPTPLTATISAVPWRCSGLESAKSTGITQTEPHRGVLGALYGLGYCGYVAEKRFIKPYVPEA